ncbi:MAG: conjugal transfer protein TraO, partial [Flavobacteriales bacterium]|nr:conjugal transfer protein TraO [Flavobacteriales bacterium]
TKTKNYFLHLSGGAYGGYEDLQSKIADDNKSKFIYGLKTGIDNEFYFAKKFIFSLQFNQYYSINSGLGTFHWIGLAGLKYIIK